ncbi:MAG: glutamate racemase [Polyangiaceae bacterium]
MPLDPNLPLGVFDSGLGGLTVVHALGSALPRESIIYLGDTARVPYGTRSAETVIRYAKSCAAVLVRRGIKALVVACNTASAVSIDALRAELDLPVIGVVEPGAAAAVAAAAEVERQGRDAVKIGVLGTAGTVRSGAYPRAVAKRSTRLEVLAMPAPLLVPLVEEGWLEGDVPELAVARYVTPLIEQGVGVLVLGCTHYPLLRPVIERVAERIAGRPIPVVDSAEATAAAVGEAIAEQRLPPTERRAPRGLELLVTDLPASFEAVASRFLAEALPPATQIDLAG